MFTSLQTSFFQKSWNCPADLDETAGQMFRADFLSDATFYGMMASEKPDRETGGFDMLKTRKERAYLIAILAVLAAIIGVIIFGLHLRRSAAKEAAAAATPRPTAEQKQGFSLVKEEETVVLETVQDGLKAMGELVTEEYSFTEVITYSNLKKFLGIDLPWTETSYIASYDGVIRAGIDFAAVKVASEQLDDGVHLTVTLPKSKIQSTEIDPDSFILYSEKTGLGNPLSASDFNQSLTELEHDAQKNAVDKGVLTRADEQAKLLIERFIQSILVEDSYTLEFASS